jgi:hypothetical protein
MFRALISINHVASTTDNTDSATAASISKIIDGMRP